MELIFTLEKIEAAAIHFWKETNGYNVYAFKGEMGSGKTTFIHALCNQINVTDNVSSPTFSIINQYGTENGQIIYHMDLYRIKDEKEAVHAGIEDCLYSGNTCLVEWPEKIAGLLPASTLYISLAIIDTNTRKLQINL